MTYNITNWTAINSWEDFLAVANTNSGGWFWTGINLMIFLVLFISLNQYGWEAALMSSAFFGLIISIFLVYMNLVAWWISGMFIGIILLMFMYLAWSSRQ